MPQFLFDFDEIKHNKHFNIAQMYIRDERRENDGKGDGDGNCFEYTSE